MTSYTGDYKQGGRDENTTCLFLLYNFKTI